MKSPARSRDELERMLESGRLHKVAGHVTLDSRIRVLDAAVVELRERVLACEQACARVSEHVEAGGGVHTRAGVEAQGITHSDVLVGGGVESGGGVVLDRLVGLGLVVRCLGCGKELAVSRSHGSGGRVNRRFCNGGCRVRWEVRSGGRNPGGLKAGSMGVRRMDRDRYRSGLYVLYRFLVGRGWVGVKGIFSGGVLGVWWWEGAVSGVRVRKLLGMMVGLGLLLERRVQAGVGGFVRVEWSVVEPVVGEILW